MCAIEDFILATICNGDKARFDWLHRWMKRIFLMIEDQTLRTPFICGSRKIWNAFETFLHLIGDEGCRSLSTSIKNIKLERKLFVLIECDHKNASKVMEYVYKLRETYDHGKIILYSSDASVMHLFPKKEFKHFHIFDDSKYTGLVDMIIDNLNKHIFKQHVPEQYIVKTILTTTLC